MPHLNSEQITATLIDYLERLVAETPPSGGAGNDPLLDEFLRHVCAVPTELARDLLAHCPRLLAFKPELARRYANHVRSQELKQASELLEAKTAPVGGILKSDLGDFGRRTYARVTDLFDNLDFAGCRQFWMIGCGPLPATLLHVLARTSVPQIVGVDLDREALRWAEALTDRLGATRARFEHHDGASLDYGDADVVYVANLVRPKQSVMQRIAATAREDVPVVLRDPVGLGCLWADRGVAHLGEVYEVRGWGRPDHSFLSTHVFLRRRSRKESTT